MKIIAIRAGNAFLTIQASISNFVSSCWLFYREKNGSLEISRNGNCANKSKKASTFTRERFLGLNKALIIVRRVMKMKKYSRMSAALGSLLS
jgi:hypothetical protein